MILDKSIVTSTQMATNICNTNIPKTLDEKLVRRLNLAYPLRMKANTSFQINTKYRIHQNQHNKKR